MEKIKAALKNTSEALMQIPIFSPNTMKYYINQIRSFSNEIGSYEYEMVIKHFQRFISKKYEDSKDVNSIFFELSLQQLNNDTLIFLILMNALIDVDLGDKTAKGDRIMREIAEIPPSTNPFVFDLLLNIFHYLKRVLRCSIQIILQPFNTKVLKWGMNPTDTVAMTAGIRLLILMINNFPSCIENMVPAVCGVIENNLRKPDVSVRTIALELLSSFLKLPSSTIGNSDISIATTLLNHLTNPTTTSLDGYIKGLEMIMKVNPSIPVINSKLSIPNLELIEKEKDSDKKIKNLQLAVFCAEAIPDAYNDKAISTFLSIVLPMCRKKHPLHVDALDSLSRFVIFLSHKKDIMKSELTSFIRSYSDPIDSTEACVAILSVLALTDSDDREFERLFRLALAPQIPLSPKITYGLQKLILLRPSHKEQVYNIFIEKADQNILSLNSSAADITASFRALMSLPFPSDHLQTPIILRYSLHLSNPDIEVREATYDFLLQYHSKHPDRDVIMRILYDVSAESNNSLRESIFPRLRKEPKDPLLISPLSALLHDSSTPIRIDAFSFLTTMLHLPNVLEILSEFLFEKVRDLKNSTSVLKETVQLFLVAIYPISPNYAPFLNEKVINSNSHRDSFRLSNEISNQPMNHFAEDLSSTLTKEQQEQVKAAAKQLIAPFSKFMIKTLLGYEHVLSSSSLLLLSGLVRLNPQDSDLDVNLLVTHIKNALLVHSSPKKLDACITLFLSALESTSLAESIYSTHSFLIGSLLPVAKFQSPELSFEKLLTAISDIGPIRPDYVTSIVTQSNKTENTQPTANTFITKWETKDPEDSLTFACFGVAVNSLFDILQNRSLLALHTIAIDCFLNVLKNNRRFIPYMEDQMVEISKSLITSPNMSTVQTMVKNMSTVLLVLGEASFPLLPDYADSLVKTWKDGTIEKSQLVQKMELLTVFSKNPILYLPKVVSVFISDIDNLPDKTVIDLLSSFVSFETSIKNIDHLIYPPLLSWISSKASDPSKENFAKDALGYLKTFLLNGGSQKYYTRVIRALFQIVQMNPHLMASAFPILSVIAIHIGSLVLLLIPQIRQYFNLSVPEAKVFNSIISAYEKGLPLPKEIQEDSDYKPSSITPKSLLGSRQKTITSKVNPAQFNIPSNLSNYDTQQWLTYTEDIFNFVIKNSGSRAIQACAPLSERHPGFREAILIPALALLFYQKEKDPKMQSLITTVCTSDKVPRSVLRTFLRVFELVEIAGIKNPNSIDVVAETALISDLPQTALRNFEALYLQKPSEKVSENLIEINHKLGLPLAAKGVWIQARAAKYNTNLKTLERLGMWTEALDEYNTLLSKDPSNSDLLGGKFRCLKSMSKYLTLDQTLSSLKKSNIVSPQNSNLISTLAASIHWHLFQDKEFDAIASEMNSGFFRIIYDINHGDYNHAQNLINSSRVDNVDNIFPMIAEGYERVYSTFSEVALLSECEEVIRFLQAQNLSKSASPEERNIGIKQLDVFRRRWNLRFSLLPDDPEILFSHLRLISIAIPHTEMAVEWDRFIDSCLSHSALEFAESTAACLTCFTPARKQFLDARLAHVNGKTDDAEKILSELLQSNTIGSQSIKGSAEKEFAGWLSTSKLSDAIQYARSAVKSLPEDLDAWRILARVSNALYEKTKDPKFLTEAFESFMTGIRLEPEKPLAFTLPALSVVFRKGNQEIFTQFKKMLSEFPEYVWIGVLPQILAKMNAKETTLRETLQDLTFRVGLQYPQIILYSLLVPLNGEDPERKQIASALYDKLKAEYPVVVQTIRVFADEMIRVAATWWEMWMTQLDEASRAYLSRENLDEMIQILLGLHQMSSKIPTTPYEIAFVHEFGQTCINAERFIKDYSQTKSDMSLHAAWQLYSRLYYSMKPIIAQIKTIDLKNASSILSTLFTSNPFLGMKPASTCQNPTEQQLQNLANERNCTIFVPGTFKRGQRLIETVKLDDELIVMQSKQRPRKMELWGSDGVKYSFLLKAHEDTRLDDRVMQLFTYMNTLVEQTNYPLRSKLTITTYKVVPLTGEVGLIGWVPQCNTVYGLLKQYREKMQIDIQGEETLAFKELPKYDDAPIEQKISAFKKAQEISDGNELKILLLGLSSDTTNWVEKRLNYSTSLAVTSIAGYILGLGDRHLSNIMMKSGSGKLVHIDFGDCFEVAQHRENYPECVPFRLTRLLVNTLEVSKIEGTFRSCSENIMSLVRKENDQILGLLEVFIYDPLLQWISQESAENSSSAVGIVKRIEDKLTGNDFKEKTALPVDQQVELLIQQATDIKNIANMFHGWCPWW